MDPLTHELVNRIENLRTGLMVQRDRAGERDEAMYRKTAFEFDNLIGRLEHVSRSLQHGGIRLPP